ncbi:hypothetical protein TNCV_3801861 [Trichonephila clavipes]|nr:hypothetical protein TNCV_3801861 [Trichonephila clavipes]
MHRVCPCTYKTGWEAENIDRNLNPTGKRGQKKTGGAACHLSWLACEGLSFQESNDCDKHESFHKHQVG